MNFIKDMTMNLDWKFKRGDVPFPGYKGIDDSEWEQVTIPHDWSVEEEFSIDHASGTGYLPGGVGWYRKTFELEESLKGKKITIEFDGVYNNAQVWCNTYYLGKRPYGYSAFAYDISEFLEFGDTPNVISVKVDHKDIADSRWFTGSGIYREVRLTASEHIHFRRHGVFVTTPAITNEKANVAIQLEIDNETDADSTIRIENLLVDGDGNICANSAEIVKILASSECIINQSLEVSEPKLWSVDEPNLYILVSKLFCKEELCDQVETTIGIRDIRFDSQKGFYLNGENLKLKGLCIHHDAGCLGAAVPKKVWRRRLEKFKAVGCNAIRMAHNPPAANLLDLCDEMGFLVMDEAFDEWEGVKNKWWQGHNVYPPKHFGYYEDFPEWHERDLKEMVLRDRNHPSIFAWSIGNEVDYPNDPYCHPSFKTMTGNNDKDKPAAERQYDPNKPNAERLATIARKLAAHVKECDTTRPVTAALAFPELSNLTGYADALDIVGYNYKEEHYEADCTQYPDRVIYGSENGKHLDQWLVVKDNDHICGQFLWTGIDFLGEAQGWPVRVSQAGLMDLTGRAKTSYYLRQSLWSSEPMVKAATVKEHDLLKDWWSRGDVGHWNYEEGEEIRIYAYSNCDEVELFLMGESLGKKDCRACEVSKNGYEIYWVVPFAPGEVKLIGYRSNIKVCEDLLVTASEAVKLEIVSDVHVLKADGEDIAQIEVKAIDDKGHFVYHSDQWLEISSEGAGQVIGIENGNPRELEPYKSRKRALYNGQMLIYIRANQEVGEIIMNIQSDSFEMATMVLRTE